MEEESLKPRIRFKGFTEDWEQRKLGDIGYTYTGLSGKTSSDFGHGKAQYITYMNVFSNPVASKYMVDSIEIDNSQSKVLYGDILFTTSSETPEEVGMSSIWLENCDNTYLNSFCFGYRLKENQIPQYLAYMLRSPSVRDKITLLAQGISRYNISKTKMMDILIPFPKREEQELIGKTMVEIDNLITLHQRKYEKLQTIKKSLLENMFPSNGMATPKIRFKGFTEAWEQRELGELFDYERPDYYIVSSDRYDEQGATPVLTANKAFVLGYTDETKTCGYPCIIFDDFTLDCKYVDFKFMVKSSAIKILKTKNGQNLYFAFQRLNSANIENLGHARHYISVVQPTATYVPKEREQSKIADIFYNLDNLITLHQRKYEKLKNIKKSLLENMFV